LFSPFIPSYALFPTLDVRPHGTANTTQPIISFNRLFILELRIQILACPRAAGCALLKGSIHERQSCSMRD
jgi:hypothetical protein